MKNSIFLSVEVGYDIRTTELTADEWGDVQNGVELHKSVLDWYEGEEFTYEFHFNSSMEQGSTLVVTYDDCGVGFIGNISEAFIEEL